jgi:hypothetical protein
MKYFFSLLFVFSFFFGHSQVYTRNYEIKAGDNVIGNVRAVKHDEGSVVQYDVTSEVKYKLLFTIEVSYKVQASYKDGKLVSSSATVYLNGDIQNTVDIEKTGDHYTVVKDGHTTRIYQDINFSSAKLYFSRPDEIKSVLSETEGRLMNLSKTADEKFKLRDPEKSSSLNTYDYSSDQGLHSIEIERRLFPTLKLYHVRQPEEVTVDEE